MLLPGWDAWHVGPQLTRAMGRVVREKIVASGLVQEVVGYHTGPRVGQARITGAGSQTQRLDR